VTDTTTESLGPRGRGVLDILRVEADVGQVVVGQPHLVRSLMVGLLADGHVLLEGVPGLAKTLAVRALAAAIDCRFRRIQFTPDLLPADVIGTMVYNQKTGDFLVQRGPIFANIVLADEINRAPAKVQSALLEAMQERQVTIGGESFALDEPFLVLATQNPIEQEGTYPLPEAQVDRFMMKLKVTYPARSDESAMLDRLTGNGAAHPPLPAPVTDAAGVMGARARVNDVYLDPRAREYALDLVRATREPASMGLPALAPLIAYGASPRAGIALVRAAKASAYIDGRDHVTPGDIKTVAPDVLRHRVILTYEADAEAVTSDDVITRVLDFARVP
jgi:MoxR-like ATPase